MLNIPVALFTKFSILLNKKSVTVSVGKFGDSPDSTAPFHFAGKSGTVPSIAMAGSINNTHVLRRTKTL